MKPIISILVPTYQRPDLLQRCLTKLLTAIPDRREEFEVLIGDDSRNNEINQSVIEFFQREWTGAFSYTLNASSLGQQRNFNALINAAQGEFIQFIHDDDYLLPGAGATFIKVARAQSSFPVPVKFGVHLVTIDEKVSRVQTCSRKNLLPAPQAVRRLVSESSYVRFPAMFVPRKSYLQAGLFDLSKGYLADQAMWLNLAKEHGLQEHPECTVGYTVHDAAGTSSMFTPEFIKNLHQLLREHVPFSTADQAEQDRLVGSFIWRFALAGMIRALRTNDWDTLSARTQLCHLPAMKQAPCPLKWMPLKCFFLATARLRSISS